jgi:excisionase family DNA binding protein
MSEEYLTPQEVATMLRVSVSTIYHWVSTGELKAFRIGTSRKVIRIPRSAVDLIVQPTQPEKEPVTH